MGASDPPAVLVPWHPHGVLGVAARVVRMWVRLDPEPVPDLSLSGGIPGYSMRWADARSHVGLRVWTVTAYAYPLWVGPQWECEVVLAGGWLHRPADVVSASDFAEWAHYGDPEDFTEVEVLRPHLVGFPAEVDALIFGKSYLTRWWKFQRHTYGLRSA